MIVDQKGSSLLYLPLDKLMATTNAAPVAPASDVAVGATRKSETGSASDNLRNRDRDSR